MTKNVPNGTKFDIRWENGKWWCRALVDTEEHGFVWHDLGSHVLIESAYRSCTEILRR